jgi:predicted DNA-binding protein with PD1-like motif
MGIEMEVARSGQCVMLRLEHGEDILGSMAEVVKSEEMTSVITAGLGMIVDFELGFFDRGTYVRRRYDEPHELLSLQGSVSSEGENRTHIHATVANKDHEAFGGHLLGGKVWMSNEIALLRLEGIRSRREQDPIKKVGVLHFTK